MENITSAVTMDLFKLNKGGCSPELIQEFLSEKVNDYSVVLQVLKGIEKQAQLLFETND